MLFYLDVFPTSKNLDTSLKKNTAFIKRCRVSLVEDQQATLLKEISTLSLDKYLSEIVADLTEGFTKCKSSGDLFTGVEVASALHQRFGARFSCTLLHNFFRGISNPPKAKVNTLTAEARVKEDQVRNDRHKIVLRVLIELWLVGVFRLVGDVIAEGFEVPSYATRKSKTGVTYPPPLSALREVLIYDMEEFTATAIPIMILKNYGGILIGGLTDTKESIQLAPLDIQDTFKMLFDGYTSALINKVKELAKSARRQEKRNEDVYIRTGRILEERETGHQELIRTAEELNGSSRILCDYLDLEMPELKFSNNDEENGDGMTIRKGGEGSTKVEELGVWDDEEQRKFYEDLVDLKELAGSLGSESESKEEKDSVVETEETESESQMNCIEQPEEKVPSKIAKDEEEEQEILKQLDELELNDDEQSHEADSDLAGNEEEDEDDAEVEQDLEEGSGDEVVTAGSQVEALLLRLCAQTSRDTVDQVAIGLAELNNKATQNRVIRFLEEVPLMDDFKLPFYCRLVATLDSVFDYKLSERLIAYVDRKFQGLQVTRKKDNLFFRRLFNIKYISEMVKFNMLPKHVIFNKFKTMIERLDGSNVENLAHLLEGCGRYLIRHTATKAMMVKMLVVLDKQKNKKYLTPDQKSRLDSALFYVNTLPETLTKAPVKERPIIEQYIYKLVYLDLRKENWKAVLEQFLKLDWNDEEVTIKAMKKVFCKIWKVKYGSIELMAEILTKLSVQYEWFSVYVIDSIFENVKRGLELAKFSLNQQRVSEVRFLGELYRFGIIDSSLIFETFYGFISFGHGNGGRPMPGVECAIDGSNDFFRIRLICTLLENAKVAEKLMVSENNKLDLFLSFFQYYIYTKKPLSMDSEFQVRDVFDLLRPGMKLCGNFKAAAEGLQISISKANGTYVPKREQQSQQNQDSVPEEVHVETEEERLEKEEKERIRKLEAKRVHAAKEDLKVMAEFERDFQKLMIDRISTNNASTSRPIIFDEPLPSKRNLVTRGQHEVIDTTGNRNSVLYTLITKKGPKKQAQSVEIPNDSNFVVSVAQNKERLKLEQEKIKKVILQQVQNNSLEENNNTDGSLKPIVQPEVQSYRYRKG